MCPDHGQANGHCKIHGPQKGQVLNDQPSPQEWSGLRARRLRLGLSEVRGEHFRPSAHCLWEPQVSMTSQGTCRAKAQEPRLTAQAWAQAPSHKLHAVSVSRMLLASSPHKPWRLSLSSKLQEITHTHTPKSSKINQKCTQLIH